MSDKSTDWDNCHWDLKCPACKWRLVHFESSEQWRCLACGYVIDESLIGLARGLGLDPQGAVDVHAWVVDGVTPK